jgi:inosine triphosphate pyrophosphatase
MEGKLYFITGNVNKFNEVKQIIPGIERVDFDLPEIQELDVRKVIENKIAMAIDKKKGCLIFCEDVSLCIDDLNGFPGPFIKWFFGSLGNDGIWSIMKDRPKAAIARSTIGLWDGKRIVFFEGETLGEIIEPTTVGGYGWDSLFRPNDDKRSFAEMGSEIRTMRKEALLKLKEYIESNEK